MIGNDIIDLKNSLLRKSWQESRFLDKLFMLEEQELILTSQTPELMLWKLWAMKEASYKAHQRRFKLKPKFNPKNYNCFYNPLDHNKYMGTVKIDKFNYKIRLKSNSSFLHCLAWQQEIEAPIFKIFTEQPENIKKEFVTFYASQKSLCARDLLFSKDSNFIPHLAYQNKNLNCKFSLSHHGKYSAFALALTNS